MEETGPHRRIDGFDALIEEIRARLLPALVAKWGIEVGSDLCSDVEEYAWEHRAKVTRMENPLGYLYRVAQSCAMDEAHHFPQSVPRDRA